MPITQRVVSSHGIPPDSYKDPQDVVLDSVAAYKMVNILSQIGQLSEFAADIFEGLMKETQSTIVRIQQLNNRIHTLDGTLPKIDHIFQSQHPSHFYRSARGKEWKRREVFSQSLFEPRSQPAPIQKSRANASPPPNVALMDALSKKSCLRDYSNPAFFFEQWLIAEEEKQKKMMEENKIRKANRQKKKEQKQKQKMPKQVEKVQVKTFSALGAEFATEKPPEPKPAFQPQTPTVEFEEDEKENQPEEEERDPDDPNSGTVGSVDTHSDLGSSVHSVHSFGTNPDTGGNESAPAPPPYNSPPLSPIHHPSYHQPNYPTYQNPTFSPPLAPIAPPAPEAPPIGGDEVQPTKANWRQQKVEPRPTESIPEPIVPAPKLSVEANVGGELLDAIRNAKLKKAAPPEQKKVDVRGGLLNEIRQGKKLNPVASVPVEEKPKTVTVGGIGGIMDILSRRQAIKGSDSEGGEDDWDDN